MKAKWKPLVLIFVLSLVSTFLLTSKDAKAASPYLIKINKQQCVVTIYKQDKKGKYTKPVKAMLCSPGSATPLGSFPLKEKMRWHELDGPCYGQYCSRINKGVLFHSVWYYKQDPSTLANLQYNNLGQRVSHGCVRLCVRDAKWIYDNVPSGTTVTIYQSKNPGPLGKPVSIKLAGYTGWDPTDVTNPSNPFNKKKPVIKGAKNKNIVFASKDKLKKGITVKNTTGMNCKKLLKITIQYRLGNKGKYKKVKKVDTKKPGTYKITYKVKDEIGRKAKVVVKHKVLTKVSVTKIKLSKTKKTLYLGGTSAQKSFTLKASKVLPKKASIKKLKITLSNKKVLSISKKGKVVAKKAGTCIITFTATDGSGTKATCKVTVKQKALKISLKALKTQITVGSTTKVVATVAPSDTTVKAVKYSSSNTSIATVDQNGVVTAKKAGTIKITVVTTDGSKKTASVTIKIVDKPAEPITGPAIS